MALGFQSQVFESEQLSEALEVITGLWTKEKVNYQGKHYTLKMPFANPNPPRNHILLSQLAARGKNA